jgi:hypothetical protein
MQYAAEVGRAFLPDQLSQEWLTYFGQAAALMSLCIARYSSQPPTTISGVGGAPLGSNSGDVVWAGISPRFSR